MKKVLTKTFILIILILVGINVDYAQKISVTIAGNQMHGFSNNGAPGKQALINSPQDVCMDAAENLFFIDKNNRRIGKLSADKGVITNIAGGGTSLASGIPATNAFLSPSYMCIDAGGNIYLTSGNEIKRINTSTGIITTIAGNAAAGYSGDGGAATAATFDSPLGICVDGSGKLFVADRNNNGIRSINLTTGIVTTIAGSGFFGYYGEGDGGPASASSLRSPITVCLNAAGDLFISDNEPYYPTVLGQSVIRKISATTGIISTVLGSYSGGAGIYDMPASSATLGTITGICIDPSTGNLFCNEMSCACRKWDMTTDTLYRIAGDFYIESYSDDTASFYANMNHPYGICVSLGGDVYVADSGNNRIRKIIQLTHKPKYAFNRGQTIIIKAGVANLLDTQLAITDVDSGQLETWRVIQPPGNGILGGFPNTATSVGIVRLNFPTGTSYTQTTSSFQPDSFRVEVSDGIFKDTVMIYVSDSVGHSNSIDLNEIEKPLIKIFPNPAVDVVNIEWVDNSLSYLKVVILDITGRELLKTVFPSVNRSGSMQINISAIPKGFCYIRINDGEVRKFIKQ
jgi:hypothetical protein